jgi:hypothetical protein
MYHYACDWCGKRIETQREPYVETRIQLISLMPVEGDELAGGPVRVKGKLVEQDAELEAFREWHTARAPGQRIALLRALEAGNIETFQLLTELTDQELRSLPGIGPRVVAAIREYERTVAEDRRKVEAR